MPKINVKDKRRQQLMEANIASIAKRGLTETTIAHVSQGAEMSRGIVNFYFTSKENMMQQTLKYLDEEYTSLWQESLEQNKEASGVDRVKAMLAGHFSSKLCNTKRLSVWAAFYGHASAHNDYRKIIAASDERCKKSFRTLLVSSGLSDYQAAQAADELHAMVRGLWFSFLLANDGPDRKSMAEKCYNYVDRLLAPKVATPQKTPNAPASKPAAKKPEAKKIEGQMDFGDLFSRKA